jgi:hypothetical protein
MLVQCGRGIIRGRCSQVAGYISAVERSRFETATAFRPESKCTTNNLTSDTRSRRQKRNEVGAVTTVMQQMYAFGSKSEEYMALKAPNTSIYRCRDLADWDQSMFNIRTKELRTPIAENSRED